ncbi:Alcohol dehydrogenase-like 7 [Forsythia ovata]|uniref:Alcohol dehydrogenase-like 7 n=1 Tax=Forsythia ovata TaxID=205694 RepID=A0ABD1PW39_9LAMI
MAEKQVSGTADGKPIRCRGTLQNFNQDIWMVESVGDFVDEVTEGDVVIPQFLAQCRECAVCTSNKSNLCVKFPFEMSLWMHRDGTSRFTDLKGQTLHHFLFISAFSEYTVVDVTHITKLDAEIPPNRACLLSCGVSTGVGAAWRAANVDEGSTVAIFGLGVIGLAVAEGTRLRGAKQIIGVDTNTEKYEIGKKFGITDFVNPMNCLDKSLAEGWGKTIVLGVEKPGTQLSLNSLVILHSGKTLMGSLFGGLKPKTDIPILAKSYMDKELQLDDFVTHEMKFDDINRAFNLLMEGKCLRCVIWMDK